MAKCVECAIPLVQIDGFWTLGVAMMWFCPALIPSAFSEVVLHGFVLVPHLWILMTEEIPR